MSSVNCTNGHSQDAGVRCQGIVYCFLFGFSLSILSSRIQIVKCHYLGLWALQSYCHLWSTSGSISVVVIVGYSAVRMCMFTYFLLHWILDSCHVQKSDIENWFHMFSESVCMSPGYYMYITYSVFTCCKVTKMSLGMLSYLQHD